MKHFCKRTPQHGAFTLVELAIVIVIIGLLTGGIFQGWELVKIARLQSDIKTINSHKAGFFRFIDKYQSLPGDLSRATQFFPEAGGNTLDGNGDGVIRSWHGYAAPWEYLWVSNHLSLSGMIKTGSKGGIYSSAETSYYLEPGVNVPALSKPYMGINFIGAEPRTILGWVNTGGKNFMQIGSVSIPGYQDYFWGSGYTAPEARYIDEKVDDGNPVTGIMTSDDASQGKANPFYNCLTGALYQTTDSSGCHVRIQLD